MFDGLSRCIVRPSQIWEGILAERIFFNAKSGATKKSKHSVVCQNQTYS